MEKISIYQKIQNVKAGLLKFNLKKSGFNKFSNYNYYELADFMPTIIELCQNEKLYTFISFTDELATLTAINTENSDEQVVITSPMRKLDIKGCNDIQALGGVQTYQRRYLYMNMFDITENDMFDATTTQTNLKQEQSKPKQYFCEVCNKEVSVAIAKGSKDKYQHILCSAECVEKLNDSKGE